jgi:hypothetical protein
MPPGALPQLRIALASAVTRAQFRQPAEQALLRCAAASALALLRQGPSRRD